MENEPSSIMPVNPNVDDLYFNEPNHIFEDKEYAEIFKRDKQIAEDLENVFGDMSVTMTEDDDDCQSSEDEDDFQSSDDETVILSCSRCSYENIGDTCVEAYTKSSLQPNTTGNTPSLSHFANQSIHSNEDSDCSFVDNSSIHNDFNVTGRQHSNKNTPSIAANSTQENKSNFTSNNVADYNKEIELIDFPSNLCENCRTRNCLDPNISCKYGNENDSTSQFSEKHGTKSVFNPTFSNQFNDETAGDNEDSLSFISQHFADFHPISSDYTDEAGEEAAEELDRQKKIGEMLDKQLSCLSYILTDDDDEFHSSDDESGYKSHNRNNYGDSYVEPCEQPSLQPNETGNSSSSNLRKVKKKFIISNEDSHLSIDNSRIFSDLNVMYNQQNNENNPIIIANIPQENESNCILDSGTNFKLGSRLIGFLPNLCGKNGNESDLVSNACSNHGNGNASQFSDISSVQFSNQSVDLHKEFRKLQVLYNTQSRELEKIRREELQAKEDYSHEVQSVKLRLADVEGQKDQLTSALQESQKLISDFRHENNILKGKLSVLELQLSAEKEAKHSVCVLDWIMSVCVHIGTLLI